MKTFYRITLLMLTTFIMWYMIISFIEWDMSWIQRIATAGSGSRSIFVLGIVIKVLLDFWLWSYIRDKWFDSYVNEDKELERAEQEKLRSTFNKS